MNRILVFDTSDNKYNIVFYNDNNSIKYLKKKEYEEEQLFSKYDVECITLKPKVFYSFAKEILKDANSRILKLKDKYYRDIICLKNINNEKLVINEKHEFYMKKEFISTGNDEDYIKIPNEVYDMLIKALKLNNYEEIDFNENYYVAKEEVFNNLDDIIRNQKFNAYQTFERYDYFDIALIKDIFIKFYNGEVDNKYFENFCILMCWLLSYHPINISKKEEEIFEKVSDLFDGISFNVEDMDESNIRESFAEIKCIYNILHGIENKKALIYYKFNHCDLGDQAIYEIVIIEKESKKYWIGYLADIKFDFDMDYILADKYLLKTIDSILEDDFEYVGDSDFGSTMAFLPDDYFENYLFDESLKEKYYGKNK